MKFLYNNLAFNSHAITLVDEINTRIITSNENGFISLYLNAGLYNFQTNQNFFQMKTTMLIPTQVLLNISLVAVISGTEKDTSGHIVQDL